MAGPNILLAPMQDIRNRCCLTWMLSLSCAKQPKEVSVIDERLSLELAQAHSP